MRSHQDEGNSGVIDPDRRFKILIQLLSIYKKFIQHAKEESYKTLGLLLSSDSTRLTKSYENTKSSAASNALETKVSRSTSFTVKS
jgi:uncharacterized protein YjgD (DUF1641 family)